MIDPDRLIQALDVVGLSTEGLGPLPEWSPTPRDLYQKRHDTFWQVVGALLPDDEADEKFWMTQRASARLIDNIDN